MDQTNLQAVWQLLRRLLSLKAENLKFTVAHKLTMLFGALALGMIGLFAAGIAISLMSLALACFLSSFVPTYAAYLIVSALLLVLFAAVYLLRKPMLLNPIARYISRLLFEEF